MTCYIMMLRLHCHIAQPDRIVIWKDIFDSSKENTISLMIDNEVSGLNGYGKKKNNPSASYRRQKGPTTMHNEFIISGSRSNWTRRFPRLECNICSSHSHAAHCRDSFHFNTALLLFHITEGLHTHLNTHSAAHTSNTARRTHISHTHTHTHKL